jgi:hypothetical protein
VDDVDEPAFPVSIAEKTGTRRRAFDHPAVVAELLDRRGEDLRGIREGCELDMKYELVDVILDEQPRRAIRCPHGILPLLLPHARMLTQVAR